MSDSLLISDTMVEVDRT